MLARARSLLPHGPLDLGRQLVLFCGAYWLYRLVRGLVDGRAAEAFANARAVVDVERALGLFFEPGLHEWASAHQLVIDASSWMYLNSHFAVTTLTLAWIYLRRNERFYFVRNMFLVAMGLALVGYVAVPTAPPRFLPELGFSDSVAAFTGVQADSGSADVLFNPYAAIPSMHVAFALMLGVTMARMARRRWAQTLWWAYAPVVSFVVVVTANHWWLDGFLGALVAAVSAVCAHGVFARARPEVWAWNAAPRTQPAPSLP
jgi:membrane-associated phospholipid phosphatase